eukprot:49069-Eustigmatos_ZCMA.PRE.1
MSARTRGVSPGFHRCTVPKKHQTFTHGAYARSQLHMSTLQDFSALSLPAEGQPPEDDNGASV